MQVSVNEESGIADYPFGDKSYKFDLIKVCCQLGAVEKSAKEDPMALRDGIVGVMQNLGMPEPTYTQAELFFAVVVGATDQLKKKLEQQSKETLESLTGTVSTPPPGPKSRKRLGKKTLEKTGQSES
jgi:hypothetical protein